MQYEVPMYRSSDHVCGYLPDKQARQLVVDPTLKMNGQLYGLLTANGFRRSGRMIYRPDCGDCQACIPLRVPAASFKPNRNQRRCLKQNADLDAFVLPPNYRDEHYELFAHYLTTRHRDGGMDNATPASYRDFLLEGAGDTRLVEFRLGEQLAAVAVIDRLPQALSAVYTWFDPALEHRALGRYAILWQIQWARERRDRWLYLGYWIRNCSKMRYKAEYQPAEALIDNQWQPLSNDESS